MRVFVGAIVLIFGINSNAETCIEQFKRVYNDNYTYCNTVWYCDEHGGSGISTFKSEKIDWVNGYPQLHLECEAKHCTTGEVVSYYVGYVPLCTNDHQAPSPPKQPIEKPTNVCGSIIQAEDQIVGESVPLIGTSISLNYFSNWVAGRHDAFMLDIPFTGPSPSGEIASGSIELSSGTSSIFNSGSLSASTPNQGYSYQHVPPTGARGSQSYSSTTSYVHPRIGLPPITVGFYSEFSLGTFMARSVGTGGWVPSSYAFYDDVARKVFFGDGRVRYAYLRGGSGLYSRVIFSEDGTKVYAFDLNGQLRLVKSAKLGTVLETWNYGTHGPTSIQYPFGKTLTFNYDTSGNLTSITAPNGQVTTFTTNSSGYLATITNPNSETYSFTYHSLGLLHTFTKPNGEVSTFTYNSSGRLIGDSHSGGYATSVLRTAIDGGSSTVEVTTPLSRKTTLEVKGEGRFSSVKSTNAKGTISEHSRVKFGAGATLHESSMGRTRSTSTTDDFRFRGFDDFTKAISVSGSLGSKNWDRVTTASLSDDDDPFSITSWQTVDQIDGAPSLITSFDPVLRKYSSATTMGKTSESTVDTYERISTFKQGNLDSVSFTYTNEKLTSIAQGTRSTNFGYNSADLVSTITNALSQTTGFVYDLAGRVTSVVLPDSRVIGYGYNSNGVLTSVTPPSRPIHVYGYNSSELFSSYQPPTLSGVSVVNTTYTYNNDKQLTSINRPDGSSVTFNYDATTGFMTDYTSPEGTFTQTMDSQTGEPYFITRPDGSMSQIYYGDGLPTQISNYSSAWANLGQYSTSWTGRKITNDTVIGTAASTINYLYNSDHELSKAGDVNINYHVPNGYMTGTTMGSGSTGFTDTYTYNTYGEVTGYQAKRGTTVIYDLTLTRDALGRVSGKSQTMNSVTDAFVYNFDSTGRLTQTDKNSATVATYAYDSNSNRNGGTIGAQPTTATYDDQDRMLTYNTLFFTYNANGELTSKTNSTTSQTTTYTYDVFGNLRQVNVPPSTVITYDIDGLNRRIAKRVNGTVQKRWVYMDQYRIAAEMNASGAITKRFIYGSKGNIPDYMIAGSTKYRIISDQLGSPRLVVKQSDGSVIQRMNHNEFGRVTEDTNPGYLPFGFAGGLYDHHTQLVRFGARDYDPEIGRWTSKDPILFNGQMTNLYGYSFNDPVNFIDPDGKNPLLIIAGPALAGAISSGVTTYLMTGSRSQAIDAAITGGIAGAFAGVGAIGAIIGGGSSMVAGIVGAGVDLGITIANAPGGLPDGGIADFANGIGRIVNPPDPDKMCK